MILAISSSFRFRISHHLLYFQPVTPTSSKREWSQGHGCNEVRGLPVSRKALQRGTILIGTCEPGHSSVSSSGLVNDMSDILQTIRKCLALGRPEDDESIIELSVKIASLYAMQSRDEEADIGYKFCVDKMTEKVNNAGGVLKADTNTLALKGLCCQSTSIYSISFFICFIFYHFSVLLFLSFLSFLSFLLFLLLLAILLCFVPVRVTDMNTNALVSVTGTSLNSNKSFHYYGSYMHEFNIIQR